MSDDLPGLNKANVAPPVHTRQERDAERASLLDLTNTMTAEQNQLMLLIVGTINNLDQQADHQPDHLREHARPLVPGETERALPHNPGRAGLILARRT
jgi:hypothetical protein